MFPTIDPILPIAITVLTAIVLREVGNNITVTATMVFRVVFDNPTKKLVSINVTNLLVDQYMQTMHTNATP